MLSAEAAGDVAALAVFGELTVVHVLVAGTTIMLERCVADRRRYTRGKERLALDEVTFLTVNARMLSRQRIIRGVVIDPYGSEPLNGVAAPAVLFELAEMSVVGVAVRTLFVGESLEDLVLVTGTASNLGVFPAKRESCSAVIHGGGSPGALSVARGAVSPEARPMPILVATIARRNTQAFPLLFRVAALTTSTPVSADESERGS